MAELAQPGSNLSPDIVVHAEARVFDFERGRFEPAGRGPVARLREGRLERTDQPIRECGP